jgi:fibronectin-binding autotransporter adhesin
MKSLSLATLALAMAPCAQAGTHAWTGAGANKLWTTSANWTGGAPTNNEPAPVVLIFPGNVVSTNNISNLVIDSLRFTNNNAVLHGTAGASLVFRGAGGTNLFGGGFGFDITNTIAPTLPVTLNGSNYFLVIQNVSIQSVISGSGSVTLDGHGTLGYFGTQPNIYTGKTIINSGRLMLGKTPGVNALAGPLIVGDDDFSDYDESVQLAASEQIPSSVKITFRPRGYLFMAGFNETVGEVSFSAAYVDTQGGLLTLSTNVLVSDDYPAASMILGRLSLGGAVRTIDATNTGALIIDAQVSDGPSTSGFIKTGAGYLRLGGTNIYTGPTILSNGTLIVAAAQALGSTSGGTIIASNGRLEVFEMTDVGAEPLTIAGKLEAGGTNSWAGNIVLQNGGTIGSGNGYRLTLSGSISGSASLVKNGGGVVTLAGGTPNTYTGPTIVNDGMLVLHKSGTIAVPGPLFIGDASGNPNSDIVRYFQPNQIADAAAVTIGSSGLLDLNNQSDTIGSLAGKGNVSLGLAGLTTGTDNSSTSFDGNLTGSVLVKNGAGTFSLNGSNTVSVSTTVTAGKLVVNRVLSGLLNLNGGSSLGGTGSVGQVNATLGKVGPGNSIGQLNTGSLNFNSSSSLEIELGGTVPGAGYDQLKVVGTVALNSAALSVKMNFAGAIGNKFTIIDNDGADAVSGTFNGLGEGALLNAGAAQFQISYKGGAGSNDVVLTQISVGAPTFGGISKEANGQMKLTGTGAPGATYTVQANTNLNTTNWIDLSSIVAEPQTGALSFTDQDAPNHPMRFYRFRAN